MTPQGSPSKRLEQLFQDLEDGCISGIDHKELMERLRHSSSARAAYINHMNFVGLLHEKAEALAELGDSDHQGSAARSSRQFKWALIAAAALIAIGLFVGSLLIPRNPPPATLLASQGSVWNLSSGGIGEDQKWIPGTQLKIDSGTLRVTFTSGSEMYLEGPAKLIIRADDNVRLPFGRAWINAEGDRFLVATKRMDIVDLGTRFGVIASIELDEEVHVAEGRVRVTPRAPSLKPMELSAGEALRANVVGRLKRVSFESSRFQQGLPQVPPYIHWSFDEYDKHGLPSVGHGIAPAMVTLHHLSDRQESLPPKLEEGRFGSALSFGGAGEFASSTFPGIEGSLPRTVSLWVKGHPNTEARAGDDLSTLVCWGIPSMEYNGTKWVLGMQNTGSRLSCGWGQAWSGAILSEDGKVNCLDGEWHHLTYVYTGRMVPKGGPELLFYIDGVRVEPMKPSPPFPVDTDCGAKKSWPMTLGIQPFSSPLRATFKGQLDELYIFRGVLSDEQIKALATSNKLPVEVGP